MMLQLGDVDTVVAWLALANLKQFFGLKSV